MKNIFKSLVVAAMAVVLAAPQAVAAPKEKKAKKEKITDARLLTTMKLSKAPKEAQFLTKGDALKIGSRAPQGFDVVDDNVIYYAQPGAIGKNQPGLTKVHETYIVRKPVGGKREVMTLRYFGGCENISVERAEDGDYIWIGSNGDKWKNQYLRTRTLSRVKFEPNTECDLGYAGETYFLGGGTNRYCWAAVNVENDLLATATFNAGTMTVNIYHLSEARALPDTELKLKTHWKGENVGEEEETINRTFKGKDLTSLDPISTFVIAKADKESGNGLKDINFYTAQGFDIDKDYVYFVEGVHNKGDFTKNGESKAFVTVFDHNGQVVLPKRRVQVVSEKMMLEALEISLNDYAEICGIKVKNDKVYVGFTAQNKNKKGNKVMKGVVVKYE